MRTALKQIELLLCRYISNITYFAVVSKVFFLLSLMKHLIESVFVDVCLQKISPITLPNKILNVSSKHKFPFVTWDTSQVFRIYFQRVYLFFIFCNKKLNYLVDAIVRQCWSSNFVSFDDSHDFKTNSFK